MKTTRTGVLIAALLGVAAGVFLVKAMRRPRLEPPVPAAPPAGGEREGEFELFIGS